jgi:hypothetical protein
MAAFKVKDGCHASKKILCHVYKCVFQLQILEPEKEIFISTK